MPDDGIYGKKPSIVTRSCYGINGESCPEASTMSVAKKVTMNQNNTFYIRIYGLAPVHHERFDTKNVVINPNFVCVDEATFNDYISYLKTKKEGFYTMVKNNMRTKGYV